MRKVTCMTWNTSFSLHTLPGTPSTAAVYEVAKWLLLKHIPTQDGNVPLLNF